MQFKNRVAIITGGANGIGAKAASIFSKDGAAVIIADLQEQAGLAMQAHIRAEGGEALFIQTDLSNVDTVFQMVDTAYKTYGRVDFLVNNAGIGTDYPCEELTPALWDRTQAINLKGLFFSCQRALAIMKRQQFGRIVNVASQAGQHGGFLAGSDYASSKGGVLALTKRLAKEYGPYNITVNAIAPGTIATDMVLSQEKSRYESIANSTPLRRLGRPEEVASVMRFLCSDDASFISGATIDVNGGLYIRA